MKHSDYIDYIKNTGQATMGLPIEAFDDDWAPIGVGVRQQLEKAGLISIVNNRIYLLSPGGSWTLFTKDGTKRGNAVIVKEIKSRFVDEKLFFVETDFGNYMKLTQAELDGMYTKGCPTIYADWVFQRDLARLATKEVVQIYE